MEAIRRLRVAAGLSQEDLATRLGVDRSTVAKWEAEAAYPRAELLPDIARALHTSIDNLYRKEETA